MENEFYLSGYLMKIFEKTGPRYVINAEPLYYALCAGAEIEYLDGWKWLKGRFEWTFKEEDLPKVYLEGGGNLELEHGMSVRKTLKI